MADQTIHPHSRVYRSQGATALVVASGGRLVLDAGGLLDFSAHTGKLSKGIIPLDINAAVELGASGELAQLSSASTPLLRTVNATTDMNMRLQWVSGNSDVVLWTVPVPLDLGTATGAVVHVKGERASDAASNIGCTVRFWAGTSDKGTTTPNWSTTPTDRTVAIASGSLTTDGFWTIGLEPQAHANVAHMVYGAYVEYRRSDT